jgi:predicted negative regulator of RcsB-dependent stress response
MSGGQLDQLITINQAEIHFLQSEYAQARSIYSQILETTASDNKAVSYAISHLNIAQIDINIEGNLQLAYENLNKAKDSFSCFQSSGGIVYCNMIQADMELREGKFELAKAKFQECLHLAWGVDNEVVSFCLDQLADINSWGAIGWCPKWPVIYLGYSYKSKDKLALHKALLCLGDVFITKNDKDTAANLYTVALEGFTHMNVHLGCAQCMIRLGDLAKQQGHTSEATVFWKAARPLFVQSLQAKDVVQIDGRLLTVENIHQKALLNAPVQLLDKES